VHCLYYFVGLTHPHSIVFISCIPLASSTCWSRFTFHYSSYLGFLILLLCVLSVTVTVISIKYATSVLVVYIDGEKTVLIMNRNGTMKYQLMGYFVCWCVEINVSRIRDT
jgi:hypothetical protein